MTLIAGKDVKYRQIKLIGFENLDYAKHICKRLCRTHNYEFQIYLTDYVASKDFTDNLDKFVALQKLIKDEPAG